MKNKRECSDLRTDEANWKPRHRETPITVSGVPEMKTYYDWAPQNRPRVWFLLEIRYGGWTEYPRGLASSHALV